MPSQVADARMRMFNLDGSEGRMCGNAIRCVGKYLFEHHLVDREAVSYTHLDVYKRQGVGNLPISVVKAISTLF